MTCYDSDALLATDVAVDVARVVGVCLWAVGQFQTFSPATARRLYMCPPCRRLAPFISFVPRFFDRS
jgi:hypothetical protein